MLIMLDILALHKNNFKINMVCDVDSAFLLSFMLTLLILSEKLQLR